MGWGGGGRGAAKGHVSVADVSSFFYFTLRHWQTHTSCLLRVGALGGIFLQMESCTRLQSIFDPDEVDEIRLLS